MRKILAGTAAMLVFGLAGCTSSESPESEVSRVEVSVGVTGCLDSSTQCTTFRTRDMSVTLTLQTGRVLTAKTDEAGKATFNVKVRSSATVEANSPFLSRPISQEVRINAPGEVTIVELSDPTPFRLTRSTQR
jgi:hypothetical protein